MGLIVSITRNSNFSIAFLLMKKNSLMSFRMHIALQTDRNVSEVIDEMSAKRYCF